MAQAQIQRQMWAEEKEVPEEEEEEQEKKEEKEENFSEVIR